MTQRANRRPPPPLPQGGSDLTWEQARYAIFEALRWGRDNYSGIPAGFFEVTPSTITPDSAGSPGTESEGWAAADHDHPITTDTAAGLANANAEGTATSFSRSDHLHKRDVRVRLNGSDVATRNALNFIAPAGTVTDDGVNDEVDVNLNLAREEAELLAMYGL